MDHPVEVEGVTFKSRSVPTQVLLVCPLVALDVEEGVSVPELLLALLAERDARALAVPHQHVARQVVQLAPAAQPVAPGLPGDAGRSLRDKE